MGDSLTIFMCISIMINAVLMLVLEVIDSKREKEKEKEKKLFSEHEKIKEAWKAVQREQKIEGRAPRLICFYKEVFSKTIDM